MKLRKGFTLIEILVVVAIISILSGIAVVNMLEAQTRAKVTRVRNDHRVITGALVMFQIDNNRVMQRHDIGAHHIPVLEVFGGTFQPLTTPIAYLSADPKDPFRNHNEQISASLRRAFRSYHYLSVGNPDAYGSEFTSGATWQIASPGPDEDFLTAFYISNYNYNQNIRYCTGVDYDATNGTVSDGDLVTVSGQMALTLGGGSPDDLENPERPDVLRVPSYREQFTGRGE